MATTRKQKIARFSILLSAVLYIIIAFDYLSQKNTILFAGIISIGIVNLLLGIKFLNTSSNGFNLLANGLNFAAALLIFWDKYSHTQPFLLWLGISIAYFLVTFLFLRKIMIEIRSN